MRKILKAVKQVLKVKKSMLKRMIINPTLPKNKDGRVLVHVGCGDMNDSRYVNVDARPLAHVHHITKNIDDLWFLPNNSVDLIYMCHVLEHFDRKKVQDVTIESFRVLKKNGIFRISVPDFDTIVKIYQETDGNIERILAPLFGGQDYAFNYHYNAFNKNSLSKLFLENGFSEVRSWSPNKINEHTFDDWADKKIEINQTKYGISLNLEAIK